MNEYPYWHVTQRSNRVSTLITLSYYIAPDQSLSECWPFAGQPTHNVVQAAATVLQYEICLKFPDHVLPHSEARNLPLRWDGDDA